ncbi:hypothetical protein MGG_17831 [Pyricularia oryzae 70-15]|uniref:Uncharacterized protein n=4 Tax=Pyricularia oryzae TaxID=318829 RepID=G4NIE4_PYRO7|nr:uncharacterized protein MGG_17831 [Pyricularia oryzae 70-15]ELQ45079.1 hypothetical protein OOU_Y34scaffold00021g19 [Pyricularia oryzae Y34]KAI7921132.1 hypothetical protein M0657_006228 [Pyricularia oryzae]EHA48004.1 hypothetical protein MGG_17831 [Pyricularia oryzae 70-15]KAI7924779.1 hypothetical protein M9X92_003681 [Pyricularia oryzae]QBZ65232.1 hypothetical protein PoMZ_06939 [Pyricularia oryzae]
MPNCQKSRPENEMAQTHKNPAWDGDNLGNQGTSATYTVDQARNKNRQGGAACGR